MATFDNFQTLDIRVGKIIGIEDFPEARKPLYKITADFGKEIGIKHSAVGATHHYTKGQLTSEFLTLGVSDENEKCILISPDKNVFLGAKLY